MLKKKKLLMVVWNNYFKDPRVIKKCKTLSKEFDVDVMSMTYSYQNEEINIGVGVNVLTKEDNKIYFCNFKNKLSWLKYRLIKNKYIFETIYYNDLIDKDYDIIDCNDPDALYLGLLYKLKHRSKVVYDSHEYWKGTRRLETNFLYTMYSIFANTLQYWKENKYAKYSDSIITVSPEIKDELSKVYSQDINIIYNTPNKIELNDVKKEKKIVFLGQKLRMGVNKIMRLYNSKGYECNMIGEMKPTLYFAKYHGWLDRKDYLELLQKSELAVVYSKITCKNIVYSLPNKLFEYIQANCKVIANDKMKSVNNLLRDLDIGKIKKEDLVWESQEDKLIHIYSSL